MEQRAAVLQLQVNLRPGGGLCLLFGFSVEGDLCTCWGGSVCPAQQDQRQNPGEETQAWEPPGSPTPGCGKGAAQLGTRAELEKDCVGREKKKKC